MECEVFGIVPLDIAGNEGYTIEHKGVRVQFTGLFEHGQTGMFSQYITERLISQALHGRHTAHLLIDGTVEQFTALARDLVSTALEESGRCRVAVYYVPPGGTEARTLRGGDRLEFRPSLPAAQPFTGVAGVEVRSVGELDSKVGLVENLPGQYEILVLSVGFDVIPPGSGGGAGSVSKLFPEVSLLLLGSDHPHISRLVAEIPLPPSTSPLSLPPSSSLAANTTAHFLTSNHHCSATLHIRSLLAARPALSLAERLKALRTFPIVNDTYSKGLLLRAAGDGATPDTVDASLVRRLKEDLQTITKDNVRLLGENETLHREVDRLGIDLNNLLGSKEVLSAEVREKLHNEQEIYNRLTELAVEKVKMKDVSETKRYELMNRIFSLENDLLAAQIATEEWKERCTGAETEKTKVEQYRDDLQREYIAVKSSYQSVLGRQSGLEKRVGELELELVQLHMRQRDPSPPPAPPSVLPGIVKSSATVVGKSSTSVLEKRSGSPVPSRSEEWREERERLLAEIAELRTRATVTEGARNTQKKLLQRALELDERRGAAEERRGALEGRLGAALREREEAMEELERLRGSVTALSVVRSKLEAETVALRLKQRNAVEEFRARLDCYIRDTEKYLNRRSSHSGELRAHLAKMLEDYKASHKEREEELLAEVNIAKADLNETLERYHKLEAASGSKVNLRLVRDEVTRLREKSQRFERELREGQLLPVDKVEEMLGKQQKKFQQTIEQLRVKLHKSESQLSRFMQYM